MATAIRLPKPLYLRLRSEARAQQASVDFLVEQASADFLDHLDHLASWQPTLGTGG